MSDKFGAVKSSDGFSCSSKYVVTRSISRGDETNFLCESMLLKTETYFCDHRGRRRNSREPLQCVCVCVCEGFCVVKMVCGCRLRGKTSP